MAKVEGWSLESHRENDYMALCLCGPHYNSSQTRNIAFTVRLAGHFKQPVIVLYVWRYFSPFYWEKNFIRIFIPKEITTSKKKIFFFY